MGEQNKPQEGKLLTAEEEQHCGTHRDIMVDLHRREMEHDGSVLSFKKGFNEGYALAAKDKRQDLADHEKATAALREELEEMKRCREKDSQNLLDAYTERDEAVESRQFSLGYLKICRDHLEEAKRALEYERKVAYETSKKNADMIGELEAVKKERDEFKDAAGKASLAWFENNMQLSEVTRQRDELQAALDEIANPIRYMKSRLKEGEQIDGTHAAQLSNNANYLKNIAEKSLPASAGETKTGSPWISVEDRLPEIGEAVFVWNESVDIAEYCHDNTGHPRFFYDNESWFHSVELWQPIPLPAPPDSLTDKTSL